MRKDIVPEPNTEIPCCSKEKESSPVSDKIDLRSTIPLSDVTSSSGSTIIEVCPIYYFSKSYNIQGDS